MLSCSENMKNKSVYLVHIFFSEQSGGFAIFTTYIVPLAAVLAFLLTVCIIVLGLRGKSHK